MRIKVNGVQIEVVKKVVSGLRSTHNSDGRFILAWAITTDGRVFKTNSKSRWVSPRPGQIPPKNLMA